MRAIRHLVRQNVAAAWALVALALALRMLVPAGFMPTFTSTGIEVVVCTGMGPAKTMTIAIPGMDSHRTSDHEAPAKADSLCHFAGLSTPGLGGADAVQLTILLAAIVAAGLFFRPIAPIARPAFLRPPYRGPPARA